MTTSRATAPSRTAPAAEPYRLAVVGGGPRATYALERLSATIGRLPRDRRLEVRVFERSGEFGAGQAHSPAQARTSYLNRVASQVGFAADDTVSGAGPVRPAAHRPTLHEWCRRRFEETGDPDFDLSPQDWPRRYVHGLALRDMFDAFAADLRRHPGVTLHLHPAEVTDLVPVGDILEVTTADGARHPADEVLLLTGHSHHDPARSPAGRRPAGADARGGTRYLPHAYPMETVLDGAGTGPGSVVGCAGTGLTGIDVVLHLTEGRGGRFDDAPGGGLVYRPGGAEPEAIVAFSPSGLFTFARPDNHKPSDGSADHPGTFLTKEAVRQLRRHVGVPAGTDGGRRQLDFDRDVLPLVVLEMAHLHYATLFGPGTALLLTQRAMPGYLAFLSGAGAPGGPPGHLTAALEEAVDGITAVLDSVLRGEQALSTAQRQVSWPVRDVLLHWTRTVYGGTVQAEVRRHVDRSMPPHLVTDGLASPTGLDPSPHGNRFDWERAVRPVPAVGAPGEWPRQVAAFMARDQLRARQGNLRSPHKAAADGVWRDLRSVISYAVDDAGLTAASQRAFLRRHVSHHNRLGNGAAPEVMAKIAALMDCGLLDVGAGPDARVRPGGADARAVVEGPRTGYARPVDVLVEARVHGFDPRLDAMPLYRNLMDHGLVRLWRNVSADGEVFEPGGLDLSPEFHPVRRDGTVDPRITVLGVPAEGARSFLLSALRPHVDHYVMQDTLVWLRGFWATVGDGSASEGL
ncbi:FAD/NAD(P)-binding protein [Streptomyces sp. NRRL S-87]|uniref:FAD/NAD(P)-binding protein n=1 Tax=Streptomyces sp. NRRL S-87 TaxID=1463920 RepID=UPI00069160B4|nr:FAD/NAD(P)-binding protein [Streptomyces sp. NRRL S-87]